MINKASKYIIILLFLSIIVSCIDPYTPKLERYRSLLVVDGLITDENSSYTVRLTRTLQEQNSIPETVSDAILYITDASGNTSYLKRLGKGIYKTDSTEFRGSVGNRYILHIDTSDGDRYESDQCQMLEVPGIDTIYFEKDQQLVNNGTEINEGITIYLDSEEGDINKFYRWGFEETWKSRIPIPRRSLYIDDKTVIMNPDVKEYCWKSRKSDDILIQSVYSGETNRIRKEPVFFIASDKSDRLMLKYSIIIKQYSISKSEYDFWNSLKKMNDRSGDLFEFQSYPVTSNIHNINNPGELILGYFQVSSVKQKKKDIVFKDISSLGLPYYFSDCKRIEFSPYDFPWNKFNPPLSLDDAYYMFTSSGYYFVEAMYKEGTGIIEKLVFAKPECADCSITATKTSGDNLFDF